MMSGMIPGRLRILLSLLIALPTSWGEAMVDYSRDIQPLLSRNCYSCHGPDAASRKGGLRLDLSFGATARLKSGKSAIVPDAPDQSELIRRISSHDPDEVMPPPESGKSLSNHEKSLLIQWVRSGGEYASHWALQPLPSRFPKAIIDVSGAGVIDHMIEKKLAQMGFEMSPEADSHHLLRRLSFDLRGIPPSPGEMKEFQNAPLETRWEVWVDRFLASSHFGERMAQQWLDLARFSDTSGYAADRKRESWVWREWVIDAINNNMPFDQFTVEQLAGDMLPNPSIHQRVATGFHRHAMQAKGNNPRKEEFRIKGIVDRIKTTGRTWLGLTLECAECHDHKFDPVSQKEYYQLFALFNNVPHLGKGYDTHGPLMSYLEPDQHARLKAVESRLAELDNIALDKYSPPVLSADDSLLGEWNGYQVIGNPGTVTPEGDFTITATIQTSKPVGNILSRYDWNAGQRGFVFGVGSENQSPEDHGKLFAWVSSTPEPFTGITITGSRNIADGRIHHVAVVFRAGKSIELWVDGRRDTSANMEGKAPASIASPDRPLVVGGGFQNSKDPNEWKFHGSLKNVRLCSNALDLPSVNFPHANEWESLITEKMELENMAVLVPVMEEMSAPRQTAIHIRGDFKNRGDLVEPGVPSILRFGDRPVPTNRLEFAQWIVQPHNPLTPRVTVNYLWQHFFGTGLVSTPSDFGAQGHYPSHPHLLDWLASQLIHHNWDRKFLVRLIVMSRTYRQSSVARPELESVDPRTRNLGRMPRFRLDAEQIRDQLIQVSGLLDSRVGGPSVFPPQPEGYYEELGQNTPGNSNFNWVNSTGRNRWRKSIYTYWKRMALHPSMVVFDAPPRQVCTAIRTRSNTPQQALTLLNDPMFTEIYQAMAKRVTSARETTSLSDRISFAFRLCLSRSPSPEELEVFTKYMSDADDMDGWTRFITILANTDEMIVRP